MTNSIESHWEYPFILIFILSVLDVLSTVFALEAFPMATELNGLVGLWIEGFGITGTGIAMIILYVPLIYALALNHKRLGYIYFLGCLKIAVLANNLAAIYYHSQV